MVNSGRSGESWGKHRGIKGPGENRFSTERLSGPIDLDTKGAAQKLQEPRTMHAENQTPLFRCTDRQLILHGQGLGAGGILLNL